jgi:hypothetical protein
VHRSQSSWVGRFPARVQPRASAWHRQGVAATYKLHDRVLSNRRSRSLYTGNRPSLDHVQRRIVQELDESGYAVVAFSDLLPHEAWQAVEQQTAAFVGETEAGLAREATGDEAVELRRRAGKDFLVRKYDEGGVLGLDDPWLAACTSRKLLDIANEYLQLWSKIEYIDVWYSIPVGEGAKRRASQLWHRDFDDSHLLKVFLYLGDVDEKAGPFEYVPGSQPGGPYGGIHPWAPMAIGRISEDELGKHVPAEQVRTFTGAKGTMIFCNTSGLHRGGFAEARPRVLAAVTYCSPASLASLTRRNYRLSPGSDTRPLDPVVRYALS